jgi:hypothetical protein
MSEQNGYQGYANYETWACALWIDNEESLYNERREMAQHAWDTNDTEDGLVAQSDEARRDLATALKDWVEEMAPDLGASMFSDLLTSALQEIDWEELAGTWLNEEINENGHGGYEQA